MFNAHVQQSCMKSTLSLTRNTSKVMASQQRRKHTSTHKCNHEYSHSDMHIKTEINHYEDRIMVKQIYTWVDDENKKKVKTHLQMFRK